MGRKLALGSLIYIALGYTTDIECHLVFYQFDIFQA